MRRESNEEDQQKTAEFEKTSGTRCSLMVERENYALSAIWPRFYGTVRDYLFNSLHVSHLLGRKPILKLSLVFGSKLQMSHGDTRGVTQWPRRKMVRVPAELIAVLPS